MLLYPLLATLAQAGGPSATKSVAAPVAPVKLIKRNYIPTEDMEVTPTLAGGPSISGMKVQKKKRTTSTTEFVAITAYPNGPNGAQYCLRNYGAMAGLIQCSQPMLGNANYLFTFEPAPGKSQGQGFYVMKSVYDSLCVNFQPSSNPLYLGMSTCGSPGTFAPWFFQWNTVGKNPGNGSFANPKYSVISSPYSGLMNENSLGANQCYFPNSRGGIDTKPCADTQELTWFGYTTFTKPWNYPYQGTATYSSGTAGCLALHGNSNPLSHACGKNSGFPHRYSIRGLYQSANGQLLKSGTGLKGVSGLGVYGHAEVNFPIAPHQSGGDIAEFTLELNGTTQALFTIGFAAGTTKIEVKGTNLNPSAPTITNTNLQMISSKSLPIGAKSEVFIKITSIGVSIKVNSTTVFTTTKIPFHLNSKFTSTFSSPPIHLNGTVKPLVATATVGLFDFYSAYQVGFI